MLLFQRFLWMDFDTISYKYDNIWDKSSVCFSIVGLKSMSQVLFYEKLRHGSSAVSELILIKLLIVTICRASWHFNLVDARSMSQLHMAGAFITFSDCLVYIYNCFVS